MLSSRLDALPASSRSGVLGSGSGFPSPRAWGVGAPTPPTALRLANATLREPLEADVLHRLAADLGADVPFFLRDGTQLATGDGTELASVELPTDYHIVLVVPCGEAKESTATVYSAFDARSGADGFVKRAAVFHGALASVATASDLAKLPPNDLVSSANAHELQVAGAFRADVSGAGPTVYGLFDRVDDANRAAARLAFLGHTLVTRPVRTVDLA